MLRLTDAFNQLVLGRTKVQRLVQTIAIGTLTRIPRTKRFMAERLTQLGIAYPRAREDNPMVGRRMPDIDCDGTRLYERLREGKFVLVTAAPVDLDRSDIVQTVDRLSGLPDAILVRPDGYVAWASERMPSAAELAVAIDRWHRVA